jgi:hypothetical protein
MSAPVILFLNAGAPALLVPSPEALARMSLLEIAVKDVPAGRPFLIVEASDLPAGPQEDWALDETTFTDGVGAAGLPSNDP